MRILDVDKSLEEAIPSLASPTQPQAGTAPPGATQQPAIGAPVAAAGQKVDPAVAALAMKQKQEQKKQIQDQIAATEKQLQQLRKQLAQIQ